MTFTSRLKSNKDKDKAWHQERTIFETAEMICAIMKNEGVSRTELAKRLDCTPGNITQLLDGTANMTLRTASDVFLVLGPVKNAVERHVDSVR